MKRIALLVCGMVLLVASTAEARRSRGGRTYSQPVNVAPAVYSVRPVQPVSAATAAPVTARVTAAKPVTAITAAHSTSAAKAVRATNVGLTTATAQGVANIMAANGRVGHWGGNPGYEGCGMGPTPEAAYNICCYGNSGMATVDVGYAQGSNGMWYCCRRYR